jgi:hypothetical protein
VTAENITQRRNRAFLLAIVDEVNKFTLKNYDVLDILYRLQQLRKQKKLRMGGILETHGKMAEDHRGIVEDAASCF